MSRRLTSKRSIKARRTVNPWHNSKIRLFVALIFFVSLTMVSLFSLSKPQTLHSSEVIRQELPFTPETTITPVQFLPVSTPVKPTRKSPIVAKTIAANTFLVQTKPQIIAQGNQITLNDRTFNIAWRQLQLGRSVRINISDAGLQQSLGVELLSSKDATKQPIQWFSSKNTPSVLAASHHGPDRFLDVTDLAKSAGWQLKIKNNILQITSTPARVLNIQQTAQAWGSRIVVDLDRPTPWQFSDQKTAGVLTIAASIEPSLVASFNTPAPPFQQSQDIEDAAPVAVAVKNQQAAINISNTSNQTTLNLVFPEGKRSSVYTVANPNRLIIDLRPDALVEKEIFWAPGIRWRQQYVNLANAKFPVVWLEVDPRSAGISLRPIWSNPNSQVGTAPILQTAQLWQAAGAINAGFFNRTNQLPLGAIRRDGRWYSGPILNRGAIAWSDRGNFKFGRLSFQENIVTSSGKRLPIFFLNSGYVQPGIARYTPEWGSTYSPLSDNEIIIIVKNGQITSQTPGGIAGKTVVMIPRDGYLLTLRKNPTEANLLNIGTAVSIEQGTIPADFANYPQILGAGPLLLQNKQIVLDANAEQFSKAFIQQFASRSCVGTKNGTLIIAAIHERIGGKGPNLTETAQLMQLLGAVDALNFDGGSSTSLDLGGQLLDRSPYTAARVHNGLGLFRVAP